MSSSTSARPCGSIPNRGLLMPNISLAGLNYLQQIADANTNTNQHFEPGLWVAVPQTSDPNEPRTVARLASIPHGTTILVQGTAQTSAGAPSIPVVSIKPFPDNLPHPPTPSDRIDFPEQTLTTTTQFRTSGPGLTGITQQMVNNPNTRPQRGALTADHHHDHAARGIPRRLAPRRRNREHRLPDRHQGWPERGHSARHRHLLAADAPGRHRTRRLQYSQLVLLNFNGLSWPHVTVATLQKQG